MFDEIYRNKELHSIITSYCEENGIEVCLSEGLNDNFDDKLLILKMDAFYHSRKMPNPPPSVDCLILVKCDSNECYDLHLVELRNINSPSGFNKENIKAKFETVINDFLQVRFKNIFLKENYCNFNCYFVSDPYRCGNMTPEEYDEKIHTQELKLDYFNSIKPFKFKGKISFIKPILPNPMISEC